MRKYDDKTHMQYILEMIDLVDQQMVLPNAKKRFLEDTFFRFGVYHALQTMTESTQKLSAEIKSKMPEIPWQKLSDFRNIMAHDYLGDIDPQTVLRVIEIHLPQLKTSISLMQGAV